ncbi:hypothetical protein ACOSQ2_003845 [Xanthoceras sorbifolium]
MMKKVVVVLFLLLACSIQVQGRDIKAEPAWFWGGGRGWYFPHPPIAAPKWPLPHWNIPHPPISAPKWQSPTFSDPKMKTCLSDLSVVGTCMSDLYASFFSKDVSNLKPECCSAFQKLSDDCTNTVFSHFNNPFFQMLVKQHCSSKA